MTNQPRPMSATARAVLSLAATRDDHLVALPRLPVAAARQVIRSMLNAGLSKSCRRRPSTWVTFGAPARMVK